MSSKRATNKWRKIGQSKGAADSLSFAVGSRGDSLSYPFLLYFIFRALTALTHLFLYIIVIRSSKIIEAHNYFWNLRRLTHGMSKLVPIKIQDYSYCYYLYAVDFLGSDRVTSSPTDWLIYFRLYCAPNVSLRTRSRGEKDHG